MARLTPERKALGGMLVNGHLQYFDRVRNLRRVPGSRSRWLVDRVGFDTVTYQIEGGRHAGGTRRDWWLEGGDFTRAIECVSLMDALRLLENM